MRKFKCWFGHDFRGHDPRTVRYERIEWDPVPGRLHLADHIRHCNRCDAFVRVCEWQGAKVLSVAAIDSPEDVRNNADFICDGIDDQVEIQNAINMLNDLNIEPGTYHLGKPISFRRHGQ